VQSAEDLARSLSAAAPQVGWVRGVGYHESVAGPLDRWRLDALAPARPVRIQHRSGALWILNSAAVDALGLDQGVDAPGVERDRRGWATGRLFRLDAWLREQLPRPAPPDLAEVGRRLSQAGVTGVTDATPGSGAAERALLADARRRGQLPQRIWLMGGGALWQSALDPMEEDVRPLAQKILLDDRDLPHPDALTACIQAAHARRRPVAVHCVTRAQLVLALEAFRGAGSQSGDRIEHASVTPPELLEPLRALGLTVVTQPGFVRERGDAYLREVEPREQRWLYRGRSFDQAAVPLGAGTDAPFGEGDPWRAMRAAVDRRTCGGQLLGREEALSPERALALFTTPASAPGGTPRRVAAGEVADLCLLAVPWRVAREQLSAAHVHATLCAGRQVWPPA